MAMRRSIICLLGFSFFFTVNGSGLNCTCGDTVKDDALAFWEPAVRSGEQWRYICCCSSLSGGEGSCCVGDEYTLVDSLLRKARADNKKLVASAQCFDSEGLNNLQWGYQANHPILEAIRSRLRLLTSADEFRNGFAVEYAGTWAYIFSYQSFVILVLLVVCFLSCGIASVSCTGHSYRKRHEAPPLAMLLQMRPRFGTIPRHVHGNSGLGHYHDMERQRGQSRRDPRNDSPFDALHEEEHWDALDGAGHSFGQLGKKHNSLHGHNSGKKQQMEELRGTVLCGGLSLCAVFTIFIAFLIALIVWGDVLHRWSIWMIIVLTLIAAFICIYWALWLWPVCMKCAMISKHLCDPNYVHEVPDDHYERNPLLTGFNNVFPHDETAAAARGDEHLTPRVRRRLHARSHENDNLQTCIDSLWCCAGVSTCSLTVAIILFSMKVFWLLFNDSIGFTVYDDIVYDTGYPDDYHGIPSPSWILVLFSLFGVLAAFLLVTPFVLKYQVSPRWVGVGKQPNTHQLGPNELKGDPFHGKDFHDHDVGQRGKVSGVYESQLGHGRSYEVRYGQDHVEYYDSETLKSRFQNDPNHIQKSHMFSQKKKSPHDKYWNVHANFTSATASCCALALGVLMIVMYFGAHNGADDAYQWAVQASNEVCLNFTKPPVDPHYKFCTHLLWMDPGAFSTASNASIATNSSARQLEVQTEFSTELEFATVLAETDITDNADVISSSFGNDIMLGRRTADEERFPLANSNGIGSTSDSAPEVWRRLQFDPQAQFTTTTTTATTTTSTTTTTTSTTTTTTTTTTTFVPTPAWWRDMGGPHPAARAFVLDAKESGDCSKVSILCGARTPTWSDATSCACNGQTAAAPSAPQIHAFSDKYQGGYCKHWMTHDPQYKGELFAWCFVNSGAQCGNFNVAAYQNQFRSRGPCGVRSAVDPYSLKLVQGKDFYLAALGVAFYIGCCAILAAVLVLLYIMVEGACIKLSSEDQFYALPVEDQFRWACVEAPKVLHGELNPQLALEIYGFYQQAKYGDAAKVCPDHLPDSDVVRWSKWREMSGMPEQTAMEAYVDMILHVGHYRTANSHLGDISFCGDGCIFQIFGCWPVRKDFGLAEGPLPEWLSAKLESRSESSHR